MKVRNRLDRKYAPRAAKEQRELRPALPVTRQGKIRLRTFDDLDKRSVATRRAADLMRGLERDLGGDPSTAERAMIQRCAVLSAMCEDFEVRWVKGEQIDLMQFGYLTNVLRRCLQSIGLERRAKDITPSSKAGRRPGAPEDEMQSTTPSLEEMVAQLSPGLVLSPDAVDLVAARAYEISLTRPADFESLLAEALAEYLAGTLKPVRLFGSKSIDGEPPRRANT
jgi:hypothetical protein